MAWYNWSQTAASNATADSSINWAEGQAPSSVNDSARAMMAASAKYRDDVNGSLTTGGTSTAYTVSTHSNYDTLAHLDKQTITITFNATCGASPTLSVDSLTAKPIRSATGVSVPSGSLVTGTQYRLTYFNSAGEFIVDGCPVANTIAAGGVTYTSIQNVTNNSILGNVSGSAAPPEEITIGAGLSVSGTTISAPAFAPAGSFKNLSIKVATNTTVTVAADFVTTTNGTTFQTTALSGTINLGTNGAANALDTGTIATSTWYAIWAIAKADGTTGALASTSATSPTMPSGYTFKARIGWVRTIAASATLLGTWQLGRRAQYIVGLAQTSTLPSMTTGTNVTAWTAVSVSSFVPTTASEISIAVFGAVQGNGFVLAAPNNSYPTTTTAHGIYYSLFNGNASGVDQSSPISMVLESTNIYWGALSVSAAIDCLGWIDNI